MYEISYDFYKICMLLCALVQCYSLDCFIWLCMYEHEQVSNLVKDGSFHGPSDMPTHFPNFYTIF